MTVVTRQNFEQCRAAYGDEYLLDHGCARIVPCEACGTEGTIYGGTGWDGDYLYADRCTVCEGTGGEVVPTEAVTADDLDELEAEELRYGKLPPTG